MKVLLMDSNPKTAEHSHSKWASDHYVEALKKEGHDVSVWSVYQMDIPMIDEDVMNAFGKSMTGVSLTDVESDKLNKRNDLLEAFIGFDHYVVVSPLWNFGIPPQLKALIDVVAVANKTFKYTEKGPVGLLKGTFVHIQASGGIYSEMPEFEFGNRYISHVLGFLGLTQKKPLLIEGTNTGDFERTLFKDTLNDWVNESVKDVM